MNRNTDDHRTNERGAILVVDDHRQARASMSEILTVAGHRVVACASAREALERSDLADFDVILTDLRMPGMNGVEFIRALEKRQLESQVAMITAHASVETAVEAMRHGTFDYIEKPFDVDQLEDLVSRALYQGQLGEKRCSIPADEQSAITMIGDSPAMQRLREQIACTSGTDVTLLITGESGTGKELVARSIHAQSTRLSGPMVSLNCPALSPQLMESELFGHERGAFASADAPRVGRFELAEGGTILLDEVTEIEISLQAKLLRVLQERCFERVGSSETRPTDVRVLATTNRDLSQEVAAGRFREDLYYRLAVVPIRVPALRERLEDIPHLARYFLDQTAARLGQTPAELTSAATELMLDYHWPGNVRELENLMTRASVLCSNSTIDQRDLAGGLIGVARHDGANIPQLAPATVGPVAGTSLQEMERALIEATLDKFDGHREKTANALGIGVRTLTNKLRNYGYAPREKSYITRASARAA